MPRLTIGDHLRIRAEKESLAADISKEIRPCELCGGPVERGTSSNPRRRHDECRKAILVLRAAVRELKALDAMAQARARRHLLAAANALFSGAARGRDGKFTSRRSA